MTIAVVSSDKLQIAALRANPMTTAHHAHHSRGKCANLLASAVSPVESVALASMRTHGLAVSSLSGPSVIEAENTLEQSNSTMSHSKKLAEPASICVCHCVKTPRKADWTLRSSVSAHHLSGTKRERDPGKLGK